MLKGSRLIITIVVVHVGGAVKIYVAAEQQQWRRSQAKRKDTMKLSLSPKIGGKTGLSTS
jgi:hypothetical protein